MLVGVGASILWLLRLVGTVSESYTVKTFEKSLTSKV